MGGPIAQPPPAPILCRQCGAPLQSPPIVCRSCGCVPVIEESSAAIRSGYERLRPSGLRLLKAAATNRFVLLWLLVLVPFVFVTPVAALGYCAFVLLRARPNATTIEAIHLTVIACVAIVNLKLSYDLGQDALLWLGKLPDELWLWLRKARQPRDPAIRSALQRLITPAIG